MGFFRLISGLRPNKMKNTSCSLTQIPRLHFSSDVVPIKMAFTAVESKESDLTKPPIIIMHGLFGSKQNWRGISRNLEMKTKRRIYCVDARNHGDSPHDQAHSSAHMAADIVELMRLEGFHKASLIGHSMGGRSMMFFALKYPQLVDKAVFVDISPISIPRDFSSMEKIFLAMKNTSVPANLSLSEGRLLAKKQMEDSIGGGEIVDFIVLNFKKFESGEFGWTLNVSALHENLKHFGNFEAQIQGMGAFQGPVIFICGKMSNFVNPQHWPKIQKIFPNSQIHWLDAGHLVHFDQPTEFVDIVFNFLQN